MGFWVYIVASESGTLYTGMTNSLDRRVGEHKNHLIPGFTAKYGCVRLVHFEEFSDPRSAIAREKQIKGWVRSKKIALIELLNPRWEDLAKNWGAQMCPPLRSCSCSVEKPAGSFGRKPWGVLVEKPVGSTRDWN
jgi:putative endonuclease